MRKAVDVPVKMMCKPPCLTFHAGQLPTPAGHSQLLFDSSEKEN